VALWKNTRSPSTTEVGTDVIDVRFVEECQMGCPNVGPAEGFIEVSDVLSLVAIGCGDEAESRMWRVACQLKGIVEDGSWLPRMVSTIEAH